ncbi:hypothetical protein [Pseudomonas vancouverensis]|uniref:Type 1 fimbrial protein n=1 Tax=Pseudomonas vancouverensis TaxID=95300 RepID=A0A1H2N3G9_PSEVA|nr:hypothetical protein [Pseudomonas vancouverensis]KAB0495805.1 hypothetical protein F7R09_14780 [Pseudomonas vancouverensis]TDB65607.1 hypothetical protein EIY72_08840 [Pseudomonas vancouverensis]SDU99778.1 hypothetical protein SAMN05216558_1636 [Pseudomonas vancouverensis]
MKKQYLSLGVMVLFGLSGNCLANGTAEQGSLRIQGYITETLCTPASRAGTDGQAIIQLTQCPGDTRDNVMNASRLAPTMTVSAVGNSSGEARVNAIGAKADNRYTLVDSKGQPMETGAYVVTLTYR